MWRRASMPPSTSRHVYCFCLLAWADQDFGSSDLVCTLLALINTFAWLPQWHLKFTSYPILPSNQVVTSQGDETYFKIKRSTKLSKLQGAYASKVGKDVGSIRLAVIWPHILSSELKINRFLYDGSRINDDDTPASLEMEDNGTCFSLFSSHRCSNFFLSFFSTDTIDVMVERMSQLLDAYAITYHMSWNRGWRVIIIKMLLFSEIRLLSTTIWSCQLLLHQLKSSKSWCWLGLMSLPVIWSADYLRFLILQYLVGSYSLIRSGVRSGALHPVLTHSSDTEIDIVLG